MRKSKPNPKSQKRLRQSLRNNPTPWEHILWQHLKNKQLGGFKFRRQQGFGKYVVDFYCHEVMLIVELDGSGHYSQTQKEKDKKRDKKLNEIVNLILRIPNNEIDENLDGVLEYILENCIKIKDKLNKT